MTIKEIAQLAGVSIGTVDRVLHDRGRVSKETELKIKKIIKEKEYKPNIFASNLSMSKSYCFGVMLPEKNQDSGYWELPIKGINMAVKELSIYNISIKYFFFDRHNESSFKDAWKRMINTGINGLLIAPILSELSKYYINNDLPENISVAFFDSYIPDTECICYIGQDSFQSGIVSARLMKMLLKDGGAISIIRVRPDDFHINERASGFNAYFSEYPDYDINIYDVYNSDDINEFKLLIDKIMKENNRRIGIFVTSASTHHVAKRLKFLSPDEKVFLIGYDLIDKNILYLNEGIIDFLISQKPEDHGYYGIYSLFRYIGLKEKINNKIMMPIDIIMKENLKYYIK